MAKQIDHMDGASMIGTLRGIAIICILGGFAAAIALLIMNESGPLPYIEAAALFASGIVSWAVLYVFAYVAECVGRIAMRADEAKHSPQDD